MPARAAEEAARGSYGRLLAYLAARTRDMAAAEDALADAFAKALESWEKTGAPDNPEAWLLTAARRRLIDNARRNETRAKGEEHLKMIAEEAAERTQDGPFPDERLKLMFICAHPAIDAAVRTPLMLQTVLGLDAKRIASAFLVAPAAMGQRLVRAKTKIRDARIGFDVPETEDLPPRLSAVLDAIYAAYTTGWDALAGEDGKGLAEEAIYLARLLTRLLPDAAEALGLLSLMLYAEARAPARRNADGDYVPLEAQNAALWNGAMVREAEAALVRASERGQTGRYQLEAAIQSAHALRRLTGKRNWDDVVKLYDVLLMVSPSVGAKVGRAAALAEAKGASAGLAALDDLPDKTVAAYQPYWAARAHMLSQLDKKDAAREAYDIAIGLNEDDAVRRFLRGRQSALGGGEP
ncbi:MAG: DUF6596 domain-containing protein [Pseudomonadota bacterium]